MKMSTTLSTIYYFRIFLFCWMKKVHFESPNIKISYSVVYSDSWNFLDSFLATKPPLQQLRRRNSIGNEEDTKCIDFEYVLSASVNYFVYYVEQGMDKSESGHLQGRAGWSDQLNWPNEDIKPGRNGAWASHRRPTTNIGMESNSDFLFTLKRETALATGIFFRFTLTEPI